MKIVAQNQFLIPANDAGHAALGLPIWRSSQDFLPRGVEPADAVTILTVHMNYGSFGSAQGSHILANDRLADRYSQTQALLSDPQIPRLIDLYA